MLLVVLNGDHLNLHVRTHTFRTPHSSDLAIVPIFILTPLTYLGGVFYSITLLPGWAQALTHANPIFYMVNAFRYGLLDTSDVPLWVANARSEENTYDLQSLMRISYAVFCLKTNNKPTTKRKYELKT